MELDTWEMAHKIAGYDLARLHLYRQNPEWDNGISLSKLPDGQVLTRFPEVGYFNRVFPSAQATQPDWEAIGRFFGPDLHFTARVPHPMLGHKQAYAALGKKSGEHIALYGRPDRMPKQVVTYPPGLSFEEITPETESVFARMYLRVFEANPHRPKAAESNLAMLPYHPQVSCRLMVFEGKPAGFHVLYFDGDWAILAGGGILPAYRNHGFHQASVAYRLTEAREAGFRHTAAWTYCRKASYHNLLKAGFEEAYLEEVYAFSGLAEKVVSCR